MASNFYDAYTQGLEAEVDRLRGELATLAKERDAAIEALRPFAEWKRAVDARERSHFDTPLFVYNSSHGQAVLTASEIVRAYELVNAYHERQRADGDVMLSPEANG